MNKKTKKISLGVITAITAIAAPVATVISCGKKEETKKESKKPTTPEVTTHVAEINALVDLDQIFKDAKVKATEANVKNGLVVTKKDGTKAFKKDASNYVDPLYFVIAETTEKVLEAMSKDAPKIKPILEKLKKNNNLYKIVKDVTQGTLDSKLIKVQGKEFTINEMLTQAPSLMEFGMMFTAIKQSPMELVGNLIKAITSKTDADLKNTGITTGEFASLLRQIDGAKISLSVMLENQKQTIIKNQLVEIPKQYKAAAYGFLREGDQTPLSETLKGIMNILPGLLPKEPLGDIIKKAIGMSESNAYAAPAKKGFDIATVVQLASTGAVPKIHSLIKRIISGDVTEFGVGERIKSEDVDETLKLITKIVPEASKYQELARAIFATLDKLSGLYQVK